MSRLEVGDRVAVSCFGEPRHGEQGVVTRTEYAGQLTERPMVDVLFDGDGPHQDEGVYVANVERPTLLAVV